MIVINRLIQPFKRTMDEKLLEAAEARNTALVTQMLTAKANIEAKDNYVSVRFL